MFGEFMLGARSRLLPASVPFRFFGTAVLMHVAAWALLLHGAEGAPGFVGGLGPVLAALHLITLGVFAMTAMGASYQLLPVATKRPVRSVALCRLSWWLMAPGVPVLAYGIATIETWAMHAGASLVALALAVYLGLIADNLRRVDDMPAVTGHAWAALASLAALLALGLLLVADVDLGLLDRRPSFAAAHAVVAGYGFMGMLALGFSYILIPMFSLSQLPAGNHARLSFALAAAGLVLGAGGTLAGVTTLAILAIFLGLAAAAVHLRAMQLVLAGRMRRDLGRSFHLIRTAWLLLPASLLAALPAALGFASDRAVPVFGFLLVFGWLLTFLLGVLQRIMPFLASMHSYRPGGKPALVSALTAEGPLAIHAWCHFAALAVCLAGLLTGSAPAVRMGAALGLIGAVSFAVFAAALWRRLHRHLNPISTPQAAE